MGVCPQGRHTLLDPLRRRLPHLGAVGSSNSYTNNSPYDPLAGNVLTGGAVSVLSLVFLLRAPHSRLCLRKLLETGAFGTIEELAEAEKINTSYVSRILRMTLLAPDIADAILNGKYSPALTLSALMKPFPIEWEDQQAFFLNS